MMVEQVVFSGINHEKTVDFEIIQCDDDDDIQYIAYFFNTHIKDNDIAFIEEFSYTDMSLEEIIQDCQAYILDSISENQIPFLSQEIIALANNNHKKLRHS